MSDYIIISSEARNSMLNFPFPAELLCFLMFPKDAKEKAMAPHSSTLAWKIPWTEEPAGLQSMGSLRVGHNWEISLSLFTFMHWRRKWQPTSGFLPGESMGSHRVGHDWSNLAAAAAANLPQSKSSLLQKTTLPLLQKIQKRRWFAEKTTALTRTQVASLFRWDFVHPFSKKHVLILTSGEGNGNPLWYSCLENPMDRGA